MSMIHDCQVRATSMGLMVLIVLLAIKVAPVRGGDLFQCPDGKGRVILRDIPCSVPAPAQPPPAQTPSPVAPSRPRAAAVPPAPKRAASPPVETLPPRLFDCLRVRNVKARRQSPDPLAVELAWEVAVQN